MPTRLHLWVMPNAGFDTQRVLQRELTLFHKQNPDYTVQLTVHPWYFAWDRLVAAAKRKESPEGPDVIQIGGTWNTTLAALGALVDLTDYLGDIDRADIVRPAWNYCYEPTRSKIFSIPWFLDARVLYYRRDILKQMKLEPGDIQTWEGLREACRQLKSSRSLRKRFFPMPLAGQREGILIHDLAPWIWGSGGNFLSPDRRQALFQEDSALQGVDFYFRMIVDRLIPLLGRDRLSAGNFFTGECAFQVSGVWPVNSYFNADYAYYRAEVAREYGISIIPSGPAGQVTYLGGSNLSIASVSRHPEGAWKLIRFLTDSVSQARHSRQIGMLPARYSALEVLLASAPPAVADVFRHSLRVARTLPCAATLGTLERILGKITGRLLNAVREGRYSRELLSTEMEQAAQETDYILSLYE